MIDHGYGYNFFLDQLPSAVKFIQKDQTEPVYSNRIPVGYRNKHSMSKSDKQYFLYNHYNITVETTSYDDDAEDAKASIVGFKVQPMSLHHDTSKMTSRSHLFCMPTSIALAEQPEITTYQSELRANTEFYFTYAVHYVKSETQYANRWD